MRQDDSQILAFLPDRPLRYYLTGPAPCPYLDGRTERKAFTHLGVPHSDQVHAELSHAGFRRSQGIAYRPACPDCNACRSVRVDVARFLHSRRWRRVLARNADLERQPVPPRATREQYRLFRRYLRSRHDGEGMSDMSFEDYAGMVGSSPVRTLIFEYTRPRPGWRHGARELIAACLTDVLRDGFSLVYSFFDPQHPERSLGNYVILDHIRHAAELGLPYVYLGYWIPPSPKMAYKRDFRPLEVLAGETWRPLEE